MSVFIEQEPYDVEFQDKRLEDIQYHVKQADDLRTLMKDVEKKFAKFYQHVDDMIEDGLLLADTMKKYGRQISDNSRDSNQFQLGECFAKLSEMIRFSEILRSSMNTTVCEGNVTKAVDNECVTIKQNKSKLDEVIQSAHSNRMKINQISQANAQKINLKKASEKQRERDVLNDQYHKMTPQILDQIAQSHTKIQIRSLNRLSTILHGYVEFYGQLSNAGESLKPDLQHYKNIVDRNKYLLQTDQTEAIAQDQDTENPLQFLLRRMITQEHDFTKTLKSVIEVYIHSMLKDTSLFAEIDKEDVAVIFSNIETIYKLHAQTVQPELESILHVWETGSDRPSWNVFSDLERLSPVYAYYVNNFGKAVQRLHTVTQKSKNMQNFLRSCAKRVGDPETDLLSLLLLPFQHIPKYLEFAKGVVENLEGLESPQELAEIQRAIQSLTEITEFASIGYNKAMTVHVRHNILVGYTTEDWETRMYLGEIPAEIVSVPQAPPGSQPATPTRQNDCYLFLFSDTLMWTKKMGISLKSLGKKRQEQLKYVAKWNLGNIKISNTDAYADAIRIQGAPQIAPPSGTSPNTPLPATPESLPTEYFLIFKSEKKKNDWISKIESAQKYLSNSKVFGTSLENLMNSKAEKLRTIPTFLEQALDFMTMKGEAKEGLETEGIFRLSTRKQDIEDLQHTIEAQYEKFNLTEEPIQIDFGTHSVHTVACTLKAWIRTLPEPLIRTEQWAVVLNGHVHTSDLIQHYAWTMDDTSLTTKWNQYTLQVLCKFFNLVSQHQENNKMNSSNLSIILGPLLYRESVSKETDITGYNSVYPVVTSLLENYSVIFKAIETRRLEEEDRFRQERNLTKRTHRKFTGYNQKFSLPGSNAPPVPPPKPAHLEPKPESAPKRKSEISIELGEIVKQGYLSKKGLNRRNWKVRWFVLKYKYLYYFAKRGDFTPLGVIALVNAKVESSDHKDFCFGVVTPLRSYLICAKSASDLEEWTLMIRQCISFKQEDIVQIQRQQQLVEQQQKGSFNRMKGATFRIAHTLRGKNEQTGTTPNQTTNNTSSNNNNNAST